MIRQGSADSQFEIVSHEIRQINEMLFVFSHAKTSFSEQICILYHKTLIFSRVASCGFGLLPSDTIKIWLILWRIG
jgi:hypothetical protein